MDNMSYEEALKQLKEIVEKVESGDIQMKEIVDYLEKGKMLISFCYAELDKAKGKLTEIKEVLGQLTEE